MDFTKDIKFNKMPSPGHDLTVTYSGFLSNSSELWMVYGFGENWDNTAEINMEKRNDTFTTTINIPNSDTFNFCFRNSNYEWDNNYNCNFISPIVPVKETNTQKLQFDLDALIEELLEPVIANQNAKIIDNSPVEIEAEPINLGAEIANALSKIEFNPPENLQEFSSLDEILSGTVINEKTIDLYEDTPSQEELFEEESQEILGLTKEEINELEGLLANFKLDENEFEQLAKLENTETNEPQEAQETGLVEVKDSFVVSSRRLSKFYLIKKQVKLALYKAFIKIPQLIFGTQGEEN